MASFCQASQTYWGARGLSEASEFFGAFCCADPAETIACGLRLSMIGTLESHLMKKVELAHKRGVLWWRGDGSMKGLYFIL